MLFLIPLHNFIIVQGQAPYKKEYTGGDGLSNPLHISQELCPKSSSEDCPSSRRCTEHC